MNHPQEVDRPEDRVDVSSPDLDAEKNRIVREEFNQHINQNPLLNGFMKQKLNIPTDRDFTDPETVQAGMRRLEGKSLAMAKAKEMLGDNPFDHTPIGSVMSSDTITIKADPSLFQETHHCSACEPDDGTPIALHKDCYEEMLDDRGDSRKLVLWILGWVVIIGGMTVALCWWKGWI